MSVFSIELGVVVKSKIDGFKGVTTSRAEHLNGCNRYWVQPPVDKDGKRMDGSWYDEGELELDQPEQEKIPQKNQDRGGFPSTIK